MPKYRKRPVVVEAVRVGYDTWDELRDWLPDSIVAKNPALNKSPEIPVCVVVPTLHGEVVAQLGDYVVHSPGADYWPCQSDIFEATYEAVE